MTLAIETAGLCKRFGEVSALDGLDLTVERGVVYGLLGPNGAGKTTAVRVLATLIAADDGVARVLGHDLRREADAVRSRLALTGQYASVDQDLTGAENLTLIGRLLGHSGRAARDRAAELLAAFDLADAAGRPVKQYSGGMRRRLDIAASIVVTPDLLVLDEPTTGLDPRSRADVWRIVRALAAQGTTILLTTQYLEEADALAGRVAVVDHGRVVAEGTPSALKASIGAARLHVRFDDGAGAAAAADTLRSAFGLEVVHEPGSGTLTAPVDDPERAAAILGELTRRHAAMTGFSLDRPSLDEVFLALTAHQEVQP
ncbi:ATP-binding cassette domain-containing protein [Jiangella aurantiaca]|uniref:ATP-binding cassette domain-containing protein n=1 Tax=Jiangella aurantiaca TaxID=2530373 RepID=A0A4R5A189_9ACTN|nr:ATP-binding cassette domain-containing protein [Jiangella aurantiaca]TDD65481.1 ATP-binding cassette domain-containing protein [Jiangella aurantiaca]